MNERSAGRYIGDDNGCWLWQGFINPGGYGTVKHDGKIRLAHRAFYDMLVGPIPPGLTLDHLCHTNSDCTGGPTCMHRRCVNPEHLEPVTHRENILRGLAYAAENAKKTHCKHGHPFVEGNIYYFTNRSGRQSRKCRTCTLEQAAARSARLARAAANVPELAS